MRTCDPHRESWAYGRAVPKAPRRPNRQVCPLCSDDDPALVGWEAEGPHLWRFTCTASRAAHPYSWLTTGSDNLGSGGHEGIAAELGLYEALLTTFEVGEPFVEYGITECRYARANLDVYTELVATYSHHALGPKNYTASSLLGATLGQLRREGVLVGVLLKSTGYWSYNGVLWAHALPRGPRGGSSVTWAEYAGTNEMDGESWTLVERSEG